MTVDLFAGPGGWDVAAEALGLEVVGVELDDDACATRRAAGFRTVVGDVGQLVPRDVIGRLGEGVIASPPCPLFSTAGKQAGRPALPIIAGEVAAVLAGGDPRRVLLEVAALMAPDVDESLTLALPGVPTPAEAEAQAIAAEALLLLEPARWVHDLGARWIACEQVPACLPVWAAYVEALTAAGWSAWCGVLNAADYGVPQTRQRAILIASAEHEVGQPPPTHARDGAELPRWVSMAAALGWGMTERPSSTLMATSDSGGPRPLDGGAGARELLEQERAAGRWAMGFPRRDDRGDSPDGYRERDWRHEDEPSFAVTEKTRSWKVRTGRDSMITGRTLDDVQPYERSVDEPAPTLDAKVGSAWRVVGVNSGRDWKVGGTRDDAQIVPVDEPAPTVGGTSTRAWQWSRPATTIAGDARVWPPGHKVNADDRARLGDDEANERYGDRAGTGALRVTIGEALTLQSFPPDYPLQGTTTAQFRQVGNAVPPLLAEAVLREAIHSTTNE